MDVVLLLDVSKAYSLQVKCGIQNVDMKKQLRHLKKHWLI